MSHFKYEINERNLRMQLKENTVPFNEDAWQRFESFSATQKNYGHESVMNRFHVSLNRNVVLPVVFGAVIILFSFLLFNFVNIKNPNQTTADIKPETVAIKPVVTGKKVEIQTAQKAPALAETSVTQPDLPVVIKTEQQSETAAVVASIEKPVIKVQKLETGTDTGITKIEMTSTELKIEKSLVPAYNVNTPDMPKKKKRQKRQPIITEPAVEEEGQAPPPVSQVSSSSSEEIQ